MIEAYLAGALCSLGIHTVFWVCHGPEMKKIKNPLLTTIAMIILSWFAVGVMIAYISISVEPKE